MTCFACDTEIVGWEDENDSFIENYKHAYLCDFILEKMARMGIEPEVQQLRSCLLGVDSEEEKEVKSDLSQPKESKHDDCDATHLDMADEKVRFNTFKNCNTTNGDMVYEAGRLNTFKKNNWPRALKQRPNKLASAGFFYSCVKSFFLHFNLY